MRNKLLLGCQIGALITGLIGFAEGFLVVAGCMFLIVVPLAFSCLAFENINWNKIFGIEPKYLYKPLDTWVSWVRVPNPAWAKQQQKQKP